MTVLLSLLLMIANAPDSARCSVGALRYNPEGYFWPLKDIQEFVDSAAVIVRSRAIRIFASEPSHAGFDALNSQVEFEILEVLKGDSGLKSLRVAGVSVPHDDFNRQSVPYRIVRSAGQRGDCFATEYRSGAEYLLLLRWFKDELTPYWAPLAPLNEQIRGRNDPWVQWIRAELTS